MLHWLTTVAAPFVIGVIAATVVEFITGRAVGLTARRWFLLQERRRRRDLSRGGEVLLRGDEAMYIAQFVAGGWRPQDIDIVAVPPKDLSGAMALADPSRLPAPALDLVAAVALERDRLKGFPDGEWNGSTLAIDQVVVSGRTREHEHPTLRVRVYESDHAAMKVVTETWERTYTRSVPFRDAVNGSPQIVPGTVHAIGLNATLITDDEQLVLVRRSPMTNSGRAGLHISVNEGMLLDDTDVNGRLDPRFGLSRGVWEELGVVIDPDRVVLHSAMMDLRRNGCGLLGHIDLRDTGITSAHVLAARKFALARDRFENTDLLFVPWSYEPLRAVLAQPGWIAHGWLNVVLSAVSVWGSHSKDLVEFLRSAPE